MDKLIYESVRRFFHYSRCIPADWPNGRAEFVANDTYMKTWLEGKIIPPKCKYQCLPLTSLSVLLELE